MDPAIVMEEIFILYGFVAGEHIYTKKSQLAVSLLVPPPSLQALPTCFEVVFKGPTHAKVVRCLWSLCCIFNL